MHYRDFLGAIRMVPEFHHDHSASCNVDDSPTSYGQVAHTEMSGHASRVSRSCCLRLSELHESSLCPAPASNSLSELPADHVAAATPLVAPLQPHAFQLLFLQRCGVLHDHFPCPLRSNPPYVHVPEVRTAHFLPADGHHLPQLQPRPLACWLV